jgi:hypothetical protein
MTAVAPAFALASDVVISHDSAVSPMPNRRRFTAAYKVKILEQIDRCNQHGEIGALLRREGCTRPSSQLGGERVNRAILQRVQPWCSAVGPKPGQWTQVRSGSSSLSVSCPAWPSVLSARKH